MNYSKLNFNWPYVEIEYQIRLLSGDSEFKSR